jgi:hypothetical protein
MKYLGYLIAILATFFVALLFTQNRDLKLQGEAIKQQKQEISRQLEVKEIEHERLKHSNDGLRDSIVAVNAALSLVDDREKELVRDYERRLSDISQTQLEAILATYPDSLAIVRDLIALDHCRDLLVNKDGKIRTLESKVLILEDITINQDSIIANLNQRLALKDEMITTLNIETKVKLKRLKRQRNTAYGFGAGMTVIAILAIIN